MKKNIAFFFAFSILVNLSSLPLAQAEEPALLHSDPNSPMDQALDLTLATTCPTIGITGMATGITLALLVKKRIGLNLGVGLTVTSAALSGGCLAIYLDRKGIIEMSSLVEKVRSQLYLEYGPVADDVIYDMVGSNMTLEEAVDANVADLHVRTTMKEDLTRANAQANQLLLEATTPNPDVSN